jgi:hypothetical protein
MSDLTILVLGINSSWKEQSRDSNIATNIVGVSNRIIERTSLKPPMHGFLFRYMID